MTRSRTSLNRATEFAGVGQGSKDSFARARLVFPDGTSRVTIERDPEPVYIERGSGCYVFDVDGRRFLDLNCNFTTLIHGHSFGPVVEALTDQLQRGSCFANPTRDEIALAELLCERIPRVDRVRFVNTGTEAVLFAVKAARAFTGRPKIAKVEGAYHGAYDWVEVSQAATPDSWGDPASPKSAIFYRGMPQSVLDEVVVLRFNHVEGARRLLSLHARDLAAVVLDPMPSRGGLTPPDPEFIAVVQQTARENGVLVIADEVLNLRQSFAGAAARYGLVPDLVTMGKIIGGGLPIGAIGGREDVMKVFDASAGRPLLPQGGTFSTNPLSMIAGLASMRHLDHAAFAHLELLGSFVRDGIARAIEKNGVSLCVTGAASLFRIHPMGRPPTDYRDAFPTASGAAVMKELSRFFAANGIILPYGAAAALSTPMNRADAQIIIEVFEAFLDNHRTQLENIEVQK
ncbi:aspartate aminotransferase family protein [Bradyrhizobium canariense]|uniref:Aspartate aminotransferase family protein n=1 Tax=Bradyrhizobium canariense TaxID=255045 RepID=A0A1X3FWA5_9BRAD|nr:aspartate aminotransferase family protein [Bradyrhizobium canariense]OSI71030.1 aspartate aminotransferase family protein [Bradyrhizobium canariense]OSI79536.1 aspartate aminotransferase family protein [Bradyrhizobium canariense]OSI91221.1 aspartate aminotransferase family protein [Bradyrhizobium canariense]OSI91845.1 aspartate aminotransferase family protein [Bradyrhizobium canariense]OSJ05654.1 aspartate aminotransferase family protein [Bradyrhizobium canariense]